MPRKKHTKCSTDGCIGIRALRGNAARYQKIDPNNPLCATPWCGKPHTIEHVTLSGNTLNATRWCHTCLKDPSRRYRMPVPGIDKFRSKAPPRSERFQRALDAWEPTHLALSTELEVQLTKEEVEALISLSKSHKAPPVLSPELPNP